MSFNRETSLLLAEEIINQRENLALVVRFIDAGEDENTGGGMAGVGTDSPGVGPRVFADAIVDLWVMIEDSCSIVRQVSFRYQDYGWVGLHFAWHVRDAVRCLHLLQFGTWASLDLNDFRCVQCGICLMFFYTFF